MEQQSNVTIVRRYLGTEEACAYLGITRSTLDRYRRMGRVQAEKNRKGFWRYAIGDLAAARDPLDQ